MKPKLIGACAALFAAAAVCSATTIVYDTSSPQLRLAVARLEAALGELDQNLIHCDWAKRPESFDVAVCFNENQSKALETAAGQIPQNPGLAKEGFQIARVNLAKAPALVVLAKDETGAMYGLFELAEQAQIKGALKDVSEQFTNPRFPFRAIKFNLPWSPYRSGAATDYHLDTCRDINFWRKFLDMMAENRFNALSLWNLHPFTYMIRPEQFPNACPFNDAELAEWRRFWRSLFRLAKERGIETYIVNWNIVVSPEFAEAYGANRMNDTSELVRRYTRQCVTQMIDEYEDLTGLGVTLADWMNRMTPKEREDWIEQTFIEGINQASRQVKFIHRSVLAGDPLEMRRVIDNAKLPDPVWVEIKFNWSHGHSTPRLAITHDYATGQIDERFWRPEPDNYRIAWMIRNEDFFILRWGEPDFVRSHIALNGHSYAGGYFIGSEGYIPAKDYSHLRNKHQTWQYAFEKQWLFYRLWGRLLYDPDTPDAALWAEFDRRYGKGIGSILLQAYKLASRMPLRLASFHAATWDYTLYSEGFLAPAKSRGLFDGVSPFISIDELIDHQTLDPTYLSITEYVRRLNAAEDIAAELVTPPELANSLEQDGGHVLELVAQLRLKVTPYTGALQCEIDDVETWGWLSLYFADKLRAGVALADFRRAGQTAEKEKAVVLLRRCASHWEKISDITSRHYDVAPHVCGEKFAWANYRDQVLRDIQIAEQARPAVMQPK